MWVGEKKSSPGEAAAKKNAPKTQPQSPNPADDLYFDSIPIEPSGIRAMSHYLAKAITRYLKIKASCDADPSAEKPVVSLFGPEVSCAVLAEIRRFEPATPEDIATKRWAEGQISGVLKRTASYLAITETEALCGMVYLNRLLSDNSGRFNFTLPMVCTAYTSCMMLANKYLTDVTFKMHHWAAACGTSPELLQQSERYVFDALDCDTRVNKTQLGRLVYIICHQ